MTQLSNIGDAFVHTMTVQQAIDKCFTDNWDNQRKVAEGSVGELFTISLYFSATVTMEQAQKALEEFRARSPTSTPISTHIR